MSKSKYEFKKLKSKPVSARIVDSTAVRVLTTAAKKISSHWKKFIANVVTSIKSEEVAVDGNITRITDKIAENQELVNTIKADEKATSADFKVLAKAQAENEKLEAKLEKLLNKKVKVETKKGVSNDLVEAFAEEVKDEKEVDTSTLDELNKAFDEAGIAPVVPEVKTEDEPVMPVAEVTVGQEFTPAPSIVNQTQPVTEPDVAGIDPVVNTVLDTIKNAKNLATENQSLKEANASQETTIDRLTKEVETLKETLKDKTVLEQKIGEYEGVISSHERERTDMVKELEQIKYAAKENEARMKQFEIDMQKIQKERDYYKSQIIALKDAIGLTDPVAVPAAVEENKVR